MNLSDIRKVLLWSFIVFLSLTAVVAIFSLLNREGGDTQLKVMGTTLTISVASICAMCCAAYIEKRGANPLCHVGMLFAAAAAILLITGLWGEIGADNYWKTAGTLTVIAVAFAQTFLLLIPNLAPNYRWTQTAFIALIGILALLIINAIWRELNNEDYYRGVGAVAILVVLMTLIIPICSKLGNNEVKPSGPLVLNKISEGIYVDQLGRKLRVTEIEPEKGAEA